jgi:3D (Asp-Asp-Asp) domain-containing protein
MTCQTRNHAAARTGRLVTALIAGATLLAVACGGGPSSDSETEDVGGSQDALGVKSSFTSRATGYYPSSSQLEGGFTDRLGRPLHTLQQYLAGSAAYVSVAMDTSAFKYGTRLRIHEIDAKYGRSVIFRVVDTGGAFRGMGRSRIDVCVGNRSASLDPSVNGTIHLDVVDETSAPAADTSSSSSSSSSGSSSSATTSGGAGPSCTSDGACNPGNDGAGLICTSGHCVAGCRTNAQCPGNTTCQSGQCR